MEALLGRILPGVYLYLTFFCVHVCACTSSLRVIQSVTRFFKGEKKRHCLFALPHSDRHTCSSRRLFHSRHVGAKDGPGGVGGTSEGEKSQSVADHDGPECHLDPGGLPVVHLSLHRRLTGRGE